jgi:hypothetical protein
MWIVLAFLAGLLGANAVPHFVKGITKERFPTPFGAGPVVNLVAGWAGLVVAGVLLAAAHPGRHPVAAAGAAAAGCLAIGLFHARIGAFGKHV